MTPAPDHTFVYNVVWTGSVFTYLRYFVASQIDHSTARFRFLGNGCPPEQLAMMERFAERQPDRVIEVLETSPKMVNHGTALEAVRVSRDDGEFFCFIDPDILARGPFVATFAEALDDSCVGVTSGRGVWVDDDRVPPGHPGVAGEHFYSQDGYLFGSPHFAMYRREPLDATIDRWGVTFDSAGVDLSDAARAGLRDAGHDYLVYDTGKLVNIFLQEDGNVLCHIEHPQLMHVGGVSHYLAPTGMREREGEEPEPDWATWRGMSSRFEVARFTASVIRELAEGHPAPEVPELDASMRERLVRVRTALVELMATYTDELGPG